MTNYRDAETGQWTTAADAAERPAGRAERGQA